MKSKWIFLLLMGMMISTNLFSQKPFTPAKITKISIMTSAQCGQCKDRLERAMAYEIGVVSSYLNLVNQVFTVSYKPSKTSPDKIRKTISETGYDADGIAAAAQAYAKLPACSKKHRIPMKAENTDKLSNL